MTKPISERRKWRRNQQQKGKYYMRSQFTCPHCGGVYGCSEDGKVGMYSWKIYQRHIETCTSST